MAFAHPKSISTKVNAKVRAKLQNIKRKVLKTKAADVNDAANVNEDSNKNAAVDANETAKTNEATTLDKTDVAKATITKLADVRPTDVKSADCESTITKAQTTAESQRRLRMLKRRAPTNDKIDAAHSQKRVRHNDQGPLAEHNHAGKEGDNAGAPLSCPAGQKEDKRVKRAARREARKMRRADRREARKAKWAIRRTAFRATTRKVLDAAVTPGMVALVTIFSPVIMTLSVVGYVLHSVIMLIIHLLDCLFVPVWLCIWWPYN